MGLILNPYRYAGAAFDPITGISWAHAYYADGPKVQALGLSNGDTSWSWPDEVVSPMTMGNSAVGFEYRSADAQTNSRPSVKMTNTYSTFVPLSTTITVPWSIVLIVHQSSVATSHRLTEGTGPSNRPIIASPYSTTGKYAIYFGSSWVQSSGSATTGLHGFVAHGVSGSGDTLTVDGSSAVSGSAGDHSILAAGLNINGSYDGTERGTGDTRYVFIGVYDGDVTADGGWSDFQTWASSTYGVTI